MRLFFTFLLLIGLCSAISLQANIPSGFEIPRSSVVKLSDEKTGRTYPVFIKLPKSYFKNKVQHYPVIYITDADYAFQVVSGATRLMMKPGIMDEAILVGISYSTDSSPYQSRFRDYTPTLSKKWKTKTGNANEHALFLEKTIFPYIDKNYRVNNTERTYVGNSLGGLFGAHILFTNPDMFDNYLLSSPSMWYDNDVVLAYKTNPLTQKVNVFISVGGLEEPKFGYAKKHMINGAKQLKEKIQKVINAESRVKLIVIDEAFHELAFPTAATQGLYWLHRRDKNKM